MADDDPLALEISGEVSSSGEVTLAIGATGLYFPLPDLLQDFMMSNLWGSFMLNPDGNMSAEVLTVTDMTCLPFFDLLDLDGTSSPTFDINLSREGSSCAPTFTASFVVSGNLNLIQEALMLKQLSASVDLTADSAVLLHLVWPISLWWMAICWHLKYPTKCPPLERLHWT